MNGQRGVALVIALLVVALAASLIAAMIDGDERVKARLRNGWRAEQARQMLRGVEAWAAARLIDDQREGGAADGFGEGWAQPMASRAVHGVAIEAQLSDLGGCFNLNALAPGGIPDASAERRFERLLRALALPRGLAADARARVADRALSDPAELRALPAMDKASWRKLSPAVCAAGVDQPVNLNTAPAAVWQSLDDAITPAIAARMVRGREAPYPDLDAVRERLRRQGVAAADLRGCGVASRYFLLASTISDGTLAYRFDSRLQRLPGRVRVISRSASMRAPGGGR